MQNSLQEWHTAEQNVTHDLQPFSETKATFEVLMLTVCIATTFFSCLFFSSKFRKTLFCYHPLNQIHDNENNIENITQNTEKFHTNRSLQYIVSANPVQEEEEENLVIHLAIRQPLPNQAVELV